VVIRREQYAAFTAQAEHNFEQAVLRMLRDSHATCVAEYPDDRLLLLVRAAIARARRIGLTIQSSIGLYIALMFEIAPNFDESAAIRRILLDPTSTPDLQIGYLAALVSSDDWRAAELAADRAFWYRVLSAA